MRGTKLQRSMPQGQTDCTELAAHEAVAIRYARHPCTLKGLLFF